MNQSNSPSVCPKGMIEISTKMQNKKNKKTLNKNHERLLVYLNVSSKDHQTHLMSILREFLWELICRVLRMRQKTVSLIVPCVMSSVCKLALGIRVCPTDRNSSSSLKNELHYLQ